MKFTKFLAISIAVICFLELTLTIRAQEIMSAPTPVPPASGLPVSARGIIPVWYDQANFNASSANTCQALANLGVPGINLDYAVGYNTGEGSAAYSNNNVNFTSPDGIYLNWTSTNAIVYAVVLKGGNAFNVYNYAGTGFNWDNGLASPLNPNGSPAGISHYAFCYLPVAPPTGNGCTPGYWRNHLDRWAGVSPTANFDQTFGVSLYGSNVRLVDVISCPQTYGVFGFHAVAALLNAYGGTPNPNNGKKVTFPYSPEQILAIVQTEVANTTLNHSVLAAANELGCPLGGTRAARSSVVCQ